MYADIHKHIHTTKSRLRSHYQGEHIHIYYSLISACYIYIYIYKHAKISEWYELDVLVKIGVDR